jgi:hypothetical protein
MTTSPPTHRSVPQGRRPSVERTTARRYPTTRKRSGVRYIPARLPVARASSRLAEAVAGAGRAGDGREETDVATLGVSWA